MKESKISASELVSEFNIGEIVKARDRLWRIDNINFHEKIIEGNKKNFVLYSVSNITGQLSSQILIPDIEKIEKCNRYDYLEVDAICEMVKRI